MLTPSEGADRTQGVVTEVTPRTRLLHQKNGANDWTTAALQREIQGKWVEITGWLLFDFEHVHESENTNPGGANNVRATCWEIHPVTSIKVLAGPPAASLRLDPNVVKAFQQAQAEHINRVPKQRRFVRQRNEKLRRRFAEDEHDEPEKEGPTGSRP